MTQAATAPLIEDRTTSCSAQPSPELAMQHAVAQHVIRDHQDAVGHGDEGLLLAAAFGQPPVLGREVGVAFADSAAGTLDERRAERPVGEASAAAQPLAGTLVGAGAEARPGRGMAGFLYLAVVLDAWSRRVVGWAMATHLRSELVLEALNMAVAQRRPT
jgi:transposase InsO family protein